MKCFPDSPNSHVIQAAAKMTTMKCLSSNDYNIGKTPILEKFQRCKENSISKMYNDKIGILTSLISSSSLFEERK